MTAPGAIDAFVAMFNFTWRIDGYEVRTFEEFGHKFEMLKYILVRSDGGGEMRIPANLLGPLRGHPRLLPETVPHLEGLGHCLGGGHDVV